MPLLDMGFATAPTNVETVLATPNAIIPATAPAAPSKATAEQEDPAKNRYDDNHDWSVRYANLRSHADKQKKELEQKLAELQSELKQRTAPTLPRSKEELAAFKAKSPELYDTLVSIVRTEFTASGNSSQVDQRLEEVYAKQKKADAIAVVLDRFPDAVKTRKSKSFNDWLGGQTESVRNLLQSDDPQDVITVLEIYSTRTRRGDQSSNVDASLDVGFPNAQEHLPPEKKIWSASEVRKMPTHEYAKVAHHIRRAKAEGRYDSTK
jgi:hypothetical protein